MHIPLSMVLSRREHKSQSLQRLAFIMRSQVQFVNINLRTSPILRLVRKSAFASRFRREFSAVGIARLGHVIVE